MNEMFSVEQLAETVNQWCERHGVVPASGQAGERLTVRNVRYYRTLGLLDPPLLGGGRGFGPRHRLQLVAIRLLQARGLPLSRIQELLFGRSLEDLKRIEREGLAEAGQPAWAGFRPASDEFWRVMPLNEDFMLVSRRGRGLPAETRERLLAILQPEETSHARGTKRNEQ